MAIAFAEVKTHVRDAGHSAVAAAAYRTRSRLVDERTGEVFDYTYKGDELEATRIVIPRSGEAWLQACRDAGMSEAEIRSKLWNEAEFAENRYDARISRDLTVAMPWELTQAQRERVSYEIARYIADGYAFDYERRWMENRQKKRETVAMQGHGIAIEHAMHRPHEKADDLNYHTHFQLSVRRMGADGFTEKAAELDNPKVSGPHIEAWRQGIARIVNRALERAGYDESHFIDMRSYQRQGLDREAQIHMGPNAAALERDGIQTGVGAHNRAVKDRNAARERDEKRARLGDQANVIDFEAKRAARERRRQQEHQYRQVLERENRLRDALRRQRQLEEQIKCKRAAEEQQRLRDEDQQKKNHEPEADGRDRRDEDEYFDRDAYHAKWQDRIDQAGIDYAEGKTIGQQWQKHAVDPGLKRRAIDEWANTLRAETQSRSYDELIALDRKLWRDEALKEERLKQHYGNSRRAKLQQMKAIEERQARGGWFYRMFKARADENELSNLKRSAANSKWREDEARQTYQNAQNMQRQTLARKHERERAEDEKTIQQVYATGRIPESEPERQGTRPANAPGRDRGGGREPS